MKLTTLIRGSLSSKDKHRYILPAYKIWRLSLQPFQRYH